MFASVKFRWLAATLFLLSVCQIIISIIIIQGMLANIRNKENSNHPLHSREVEKLRIQLNDRIFEVKKMSEDFAEEKGRLLMDFSRERNTLSKAVKQLKEKIIFQNEAWTKKIDEIRQEHSTNIEGMNEAFQQRLELEKVKTANQVRIDLIEQIDALETRIKDEREKFKEQAQQSRDQNQRKLYEIAMRNNSKMHSITESHKRILENFQSEADRKAKSMMDSLTNQVGLHSQAKELIKKMTVEHVREKIQLQCVVKDLKQQMHALEEQINYKQSTIAQLREQEKQNFRSNQAQLDAEKEKYEAAVEQLKQTHELKETEISSKFEEKRQVIEEQFEHCIETCKEKERLWDARGREILQLYSKRQSKREDVKTIENLEVELIRKQFQLEKERNDLKSCKLELQNMEQVYDKIFLSSKYIVRGRSHSFKPKKLRLPMLSNFGNKSTISHKKSLVDSKVS